MRALQEAVRGAAARGLSVSIAGGRHSMGGQQFGAGTVLLDMTALCRVIDLDAERGLVTVEAGIDWPRLINHLLWAGAGQERQWGIVQKQTGADRLTIGGALSANIHGRGLRMRPMIGDVESFDLVDHERRARDVQPDVQRRAVLAGDRRLRAVRRDRAGHAAADARAARSNAA